VSLFLPSKRTGYQKQIFDAIRSTSPTVYFIWTQINGWNDCGGTRSSQLGPVLTSVIRGFNLDEINSLVPYQDYSTSMLPCETDTPHGNRLLRRHTKEPYPLQLSHLYSGCSLSSLRRLYTSISTIDKSLLDADHSSIWGCGVPRAADDYRCNPYISIPSKVTEYGLPWWNNCCMSFQYPNMPYVSVEFQGSLQAVGFYHAELRQPS
jgi:hypothetical protein